MNEAVAKRTRAKELYAQREAHLGGLPAHVLLDLARNEAAPREWRKAAVELLLDKGFAQANHPELAAVVMEIRAERQARAEVEAVVETAVEQDLSGGSHFDFGSSIADGTVSATTTTEPVDVTSSIVIDSVTVSACGVTTQNLMQDEVVTPDSE